MCVCSHVSMCMCLCLYVCMCVCLCMCECVYVCMCMRVCGCVYVHVVMHVCVYNAHVCMYVYMCVCMCVVCLVELLIISNSANHQANIPPVLPPLLLLILLLMLLLGLPVTFTGQHYTLHNITEHVNMCVCGKQCNMLLMKKTTTPGHSMYEGLRYVILLIEPSTANVCMNHVLSVLSFISVNKMQ